MIRFKICSVPIAVSFWSLLLVSYAIVTSVNGQEIVLVCLLCTLVHESGHLLMICRFAGLPESITVNPFEIRINSDLSSLKPKEEILIISFGVVFNFILAVVSVGLYHFFNYTLFSRVAVSSLCIGCVNLLPAESFDGGQLLKIALFKYFEHKSVEFLLNVLSVSLILPIALLGVAVLFISRYNFSVLFIALFLLIIYISKELR